MKNPDRVKIWNSFFHQARAQAIRLKAGDRPRAGFEPLGGRLTDEQQSVLTLLALCTLAIEARANHLIRELEEKRKISGDQADAAQRLPPLQKWVLLPRIAGRRARIDTGRFPHQAVAEICRRRNALIHVDFDKVTSSLPAKAKALSLYRGFVEAMEDMNVRLGRARRARKRVLALARI